MHWSTGFIFLVVVGILVVDLAACDKSKAEDSSEDNSDSSEETKDGSKIREKRSDEDIMFGNQQNKVSAADDELLAGVETKEEDDKKTDKGNDTTDDNKDAEDSKPEVAADDKKEDNEVKKTDESSLDEDKPAEDIMVDRPDPSSDLAPPKWFTNNNESPSDSSSSDALQYILNSRPMQAMGPTNNFVDVSGVFDQSDLYRRKRQSSLKGLHLLGKRSLRSPIGQMIRARRLPRRSMRLKRQVDVEQLLSMIRNAESNNEGGFYKPVSDRYGAGSIFKHRNPFDNAQGSDFENAPRNNEFDEAEDSSIENKDFTEALVYPPPSEYYNIPNYPILGNNRYQPYQHQIQESESDVPPEIMSPRWIDASSGRLPPQIFSVARRSTPLFYPVDYRFVPGYKKRSNMIDENDVEDVVMPLNYGKWGRVVDSSGAYASAEDVARLYALANLLAERENAEVRVKRSA